jgi:multidrug resistance efflux pump
MKIPATVITLIAILTGGLTYFGFRGREPGTLRLSGVVTANEVIVAAKIEGRIQRLHVNEGSWVEAGQLIAELDSEELQSERQRQAAVVQQTTARLGQSRDQLSLDEGRVRSQLSGARAQLQHAQSQREEGQAEIEQLQKDFKRTSELVSQGLLAKQDAEKVETALRVAEARAKALDDRVRVAQAELELSLVNERQVTVTRGEVQQIGAQLDQARAQLAQTGTRLGYAEVRAPLKGMVSTRVARQGEVIRLGDPIVTIVDVDDVWVRVQVEETYVNRVVIGQTLPVSLVTGETIEGKVIFVAPEAEFATQRDVNRAKRDIRTFGIKVALANAERRLHPGMTAHVLLSDAVPTVTERESPPARSGASDARQSATRPR